MEIKGPTARVPSRNSGSSSPNPGSRPIRKVFPPSSKKKNNMMNRLKIPPKLPRATPLAEIWPTMLRPPRLGRMAFVNTNANSAATKAMENNISEDNILDPSGNMYQSNQVQIIKTIEVAQSHGIRRPMLSAYAPAKSPRNATIRPAIV